MVQIDRVGEIAGQPVWAATLSEGDIAARILSYGAITQNLSLCGAPVILSYPRAEDYAADPYYVGAMVGRLANRIAGGRFEWRGETVMLDCNNGPNHLHGGKNGFSTRHWAIEADGAAVILRLNSADGDAGYPGAVAVELRISLDAGGITYDITANAAEETPVCIAQHNYYAPGGDPAQWHLTVGGRQYCPVDKSQIPTGSCVDTSGEFDFVTAAPLAGRSVDHNYVLTGPGPAAVLRGGAAELTLTTDQPGLQVYTGDGLGGPFAPRSGMALEPQFFPDAVNQPAFATPLAGPGRPYRQVTRIGILSV